MPSSAAAIAYARAYYAANREKVLARVRKHREANAEHFRAYDTARAATPKRKAYAAKRRADKRAARIASGGTARRSPSRSRVSPRERTIAAWSRNLARHGITPATYGEMMVAQDGRCAVCARPATPKFSLHVDHCHATGRVRGLACQLCNPHLTRHIEAHLDAVVAYLRRAA